MGYYALVNTGLEQLTKQELDEKLQISSNVGKNIVQFSADKEQAVHFLQQGQSIRRLCALICSSKNLNGLVFPENFPWQDFLSNDLTIKIEVENVKGQENRIDISREIAKKLFPVLEKNNLKPKLELKNPDVLINVFQTEDTYFIGVDLAGQELNSRQFRVFPHHASFKGDHAYYLAKKTGFQKGKFLAVFCKDGVIPIEAAISANSLIFNKDEKFSYHKFPGFKNLEISEKGNNDEETKNEVKVYACDENRQNITAARKNSKLAGTDKLIDFQRYSLDVLDTRFDENEFDNIVIHLTTKDEDKINEIYYQINYILKSGGKLLLITRENFTLSISDKFKLIEETELLQGKSVQKLWLLEKK